MQVAVGYRQRNDGFGLLPNNDLRDFESHAGAVPVGLAHHGEAEGRKVLVGHGRFERVQTWHLPPFRRRRSLAAVFRPFGSSMRSCSWARMPLSFSGIGRPRCPAFSARSHPRWRGKSRSRRCEALLPSAPHAGPRCAPRPPA